MTRISQLVSAVEAAFMDVDNLRFVHLVPHVRENSHGDSGVDNVAPALTAAHAQEIFRGGLCVGTPVTSIDQLYAQAVLLQPLLRLKVQQLAAASNGLVLVAPARSCFSCADCVCGVRHFVLALVGGASADALALVVGGEC